MNILFTNAHPYLNVHEAFRLDVLDKWAQQYGFIVYARVSHGNTTDYSSLNLVNTYLSSVGPTPEKFKEETSEIIRRYKPKKVINNIEYYFPWDEIETTAERIYFVRSCMKKLKQVISPMGNDEHHDSVMRSYANFVEKEERFMLLSDMIITDSPNSVNAISEMYGIPPNEIDTVLEYVNPTKYLSIPSPTKFSDNVYSIGRADYQKGIYNIRQSSKYNVTHIGRGEVDGIGLVPSHIKVTGFMDYSEYIPMIQSMNYGLFPSVWESNGYTVQEAFAMGKIPIIHRGSGGPERHATTENSIVIDYFEDHWEDAIDQHKENFRSMSDAAKETITVKMFNDSLEKFVEVIC